MPAGGRLSAGDLEHPDFEEGVCCPACISEYSPEQRARFRERQHQVELAEARGGRHLGPRDKPADAKG